MNEQQVLMSAGRRFAAICSMPVGLVVSLTSCLLLQVPALTGIWVVMLSTAASTAYPLLAGAHQWSDITHKDSVESARRLSKTVIHVSVLGGLIGACIGMAIGMVFL